MPAPSAAFFLFSFSLKYPRRPPLFFSFPSPLIPVPVVALFSPFSSVARPRFFPLFPPPFPLRAAIFSPLPACRFTPWALSRLSVRRLFFFSHALYRCHPFFPSPLLHAAPFFFPSTLNAYAGHTPFFLSFPRMPPPFFLLSLHVALFSFHFLPISFSPSLSPARRFLNVILNLFQDLIILFIRLSLFVKCMRC